MRQVTGKGDILQIKITLKDVRPAVCAVFWSPQP